MITVKKPTPSYAKKDFPAALDVFFAENCPQLGGYLTREPIIKRIIEMIKKYFPKTEYLKQGQLVWYAVDSNETSGYGKPIEKCKTKPVVVDLLKESDVDDLMKKVPKKQRVKKIVARILKQSYEQGGVLTNDDIGGILKLSPSTVSRYIREYELEYHTVLPRRGTIHDMGPTLTHKKIICYKYFKEGKSLEDVCRETRHSPQAVSRYIDAFARVRECLKEKWDTEKISLVTGYSKKLTEAYKELIESKEITFEKGEIPR